MSNQDQVVNYLKSVPQATKREIYNNVEVSYYHNWEKHFGEVLSRMVNNGKIERVTKGVYKIKASRKCEVLDLF